MSQQNKTETEVNDGFWSPSNVGQIHSYLSEGIPKDDSPVDYRYAFVRNISYNLQYLEYLNYVLFETPLHSTVKALTQKTFVMTGMSVIEAILWFVLKNTSQHKLTEWVEIKSFDGQSFEENRVQYKISSSISKKLDQPVEFEMSLDSMIKRVESKKLLGVDITVYKDLNHLRKLRNRIHIHVIKHEQDTDWWTFGVKEVNLMKGVLGSVLRSNLFNPDSNKVGIFDYLRVKESIELLSNELPF